jgi:hypothetical protein
MDRLREMFRYHPPKTQRRKEAHDAINDAAYEFALIVNAYVKDASCREFAFFAIQQARMFANQGATLDELIEQEQHLDNICAPVANIGPCPSNE